MLRIDRSNKDHHHHHHHHHHHIYSQRYTMKAGQNNASRRRRSYATNGVLLIACFTSVLASSASSSSSSSSIRGDGSLPPPPPPRPPLLKKASSTFQNSMTIQQNGNIERPPPPSIRIGPSVKKDDGEKPDLTLSNKIIPPPPKKESISLAVEDKEDNKDEMATIRPLPQSRPDPPKHVTWKMDAGQVPPPPKRQEERFANIQPLDDGTNKKSLPPPPPPSRIAGGEATRLPRRESDYRFHRDASSNIPQSSTQRGRIPPPPTRLTILSDTVEETKDDASEMYLATTDIETGNQNAASLDDEDEVEEVTPPVSPDQTDSIANDDETSSSQKEGEYGNTHSRLDFKPDKRTALQEGERGTGHSRFDFKPEIEESQEAEPTYVEKDSGIDAEESDTDNEIGSDEKDTGPSFSFQAFSLPVPSGTDDAVSEQVEPETSSEAKPNAYSPPQGQARMPPYDHPEPGRSEAQSITPELRSPQGQAQRLPHGTRSAPNTQWSGNYNSQPVQNNLPPPQNLPRQGIPPTGQGPPTSRGQQYRPSPQGPGYQQRMPPHTQGAPKRRGAPKSASGAPWKTLWNKVEQGLDGLANLEESVAGRAQQLYSSAAGSISGPPSRGRPSSVRKAVGMFSNKGTKRKEPPQPAPAKFTPYGNKYAVAAKQNAEKEEEVKPQATASRQVDWNDLMAGKKMISANGGAAPPHSHTNPTPPNMGRTPGPQNPPPTPGGQPPRPQLPGQQSSNAPVSPDPNTRQQLPPSSPSPYGSAQQPARPNPYGPTNTKPPVKPAESDAHSRASRIPWDSSVPSKQGSSRPRPRPSQPSRKDMDDKPSFSEKIFKFLPSLPKIPSPRRLFKKSYHYDGMDAWDDEDNEDEKSGLFGLFRRKPKGESRPASFSPRPSPTDVDKLSPPLASIMERCDDGKSASLLSDTDRRQARSIGRYLAASDGIATMFLLLALQQIPNLGTAVAPSMKDFFSSTLPQLSSSLLDSIETWAPFLFVSAYLTLFSAKVLFEPKLMELAYSVGNTVQSESQYSQLYLRLATALPVDPRLPTRMRDAAVSQVMSTVSIARLRAFTTLGLSLLVVMTVSVVGPIVAAVSDGMLQLVLLEQWRSWPIAWKALGSSLLEVFRSAYLSIETLVADSLTHFLDNPLRFAFHLSIAGSLLLTALLPRLEEKRRLKPFTDDDDDMTISPAAGVEQLAKLGASSASRLSLLSENFSIENALERWRLTSAALSDTGSHMPVAMMLRSVGYTILSALLCASPLAVAYFVGAFSLDTVAKVGLRWNSAVDVSVILLCVFSLLNAALRKAVVSAELRPFAEDFLTTLSKTLGEMKEAKTSKQGIQFMSSVSPTAGLQVRDLWASHTSKRAWAVRGANLICKNGEVLAILGDDEAGKTRLLTTISESLILPPKRSLTTNKVRGSVSIGGVDGSKWDQPMLKRRLGILLSDVRTMADTATLFSGWTMEELLEPVDGLRTMDPSHRLSSSERSSIVLALKITGLYSSLLPKLPSKLATIVTANEEDIHPSVLRAGCSVLSPAVWSKVILTKVIAQTIFDNDNAAASNDKVENCLMGSVLILDDPTVLLAEVEEAKLLSELRKTGAATVFSTNKWATGRFADHIVVVKDGAIVESGTHNELLARGPQQSTYAAKWHAMTMQ